MKNKLATIAALLLCWPGVAGAEDFYFAAVQQGSGTGASCVTARPISFFNNAANWDALVADNSKIGPGDDAYLCNDGGDFVQILTKGAGTLVNPIDIRIASPYVIVDNGFANNNAIYVGADDDYINFYGDGKLTVVGAIQNGFYIDSSDYVIVNGVTSTGHRIAGFRAVGSDHVTLEYSNLHDNDSAAAIAYGAYFTAGSDYGVIRYCNLYNNGTALATDARGVTIANGSSYCEVHHCNIYDNNSASNDGSSVEIYDADHAKIYLNPRMTGSQTGIEAKSNGDTTYPDSSDYMEAYNNYINATVGIMYGEWPEDGTGAESEHGQLYNNTIVATVIGIDIHSPNQSLKNNIVQMNSDGFIYAFRFLNMSSADIDTVDMDYNISYLPGTNNQHMRDASAGVNYATAATWNAARPAQDAHSLNINPSLDAQGRPRNPAVWNAGSFIDDQKYSGSAPAIGAWDYSPGLSLPGRLVPSIPATWSMGDNGRMF